MRNATTEQRDPAGMALAVLGAGEVGRGWAALAAAHGRAVGLHDPDAPTLAAAMLDIQNRVARLLDNGLASAAPAHLGLARLRTHATVAEAVTGADWVVEAAPESAAAKRELLATAEGPSGPILASSSSGLHASALSDGLRHPERLLVVHPLVPVELIPVVELIPGPATDPSVAAAVCEELTALGRVPILLRREVPGNAVGRIAAAVWRECIDLVLDGVLDVEQMDRLMAEGPALGWAAGGPHLTYELAASGGGLEGFLEHLQPTFEAWWRVLSARTTLDEAARERLVTLVSETYSERRDLLRRARDQRLVALATAIGTAATEPSRGTDAPR